MSRYEALRRSSLVRSQEGQRRIFFGINREIDRHAREKQQELTTELRERAVKRDTFTFTGNDVVRIAEAFRDVIISAQDRRNLEGYEFNMPSLGFRTGQPERLRRAAIAHINRLRSKNG